MEMSEALSQQERLQAIAEKRKKQTEIENKKRQLEDDRRQLQHLKSKALRERWLLDGVPSGGPEEDEAKKQLHEDEAKTRDLEETITRLEQELEELETGVSATSTKENLSDAAKEENKTDDSKVPAASVKVVHEIDGMAVANGVHQLSSSEVDELILKADEVVLSEAGTPKPVHASADASPVATTITVVGEEARASPKVEITGMETMTDGGGPEAVAVGDVSAENPVTMVFMGYQSVEDETETKKVLGLEGTVKAELVVIEDGENKAGGTSPVTPGDPASAASDAEQGKENAQEQAPPNGSTAEAIKTPEEKEGANKEGGEAAGAELNNKEKQPCKCCVVM